MMKVRIVGLYVSPRTFRKYGYGFPGKLIRANWKAVQTVELDPPATTHCRVKIPGARVTRFYVGMRSYVDGLRSGGGAFAKALDVGPGDMLDVDVTYAGNGWYLDRVMS